MMAHEFLQYVRPAVAHDDGLAAPAIVADSGSKQTQLCSIMRPLCIAVLCPIEEFFLDYRSSNCDEGCTQWSSSIRYCDVLLYFDRKFLVNNTSLA